MARALITADKAALDTAPANAPVQTDFLDTPDPEAMLAARAELPQGASTLEVLTEARRKKSFGGRKPGSKNRAGLDFKRWLLSFGYAHPSVVLARIASTAPEVLMENSRKAGDDTKRAMTYYEASSLIARCASELLPYLEGKQASVDHQGETVAPLIFVGRSEADARMLDIVNAPFVEVEDEDTAAS